MIISVILPLLEKSTLLSMELVDCSINLGGLMFGITKCYVKWLKINDNQLGRRF